MDSHDDVQPLLSDYVLGELSAADRRRVEVHLGTCDGCAADARELALAFQSIGLQEEPVPPPPHLRARVLDHLHSEAGRDRSSAGRVANRAPFARLWMAAAAAIILLLVGTLAVSWQRQRLLAADARDAAAHVRQLRQQIATTAAQADLAVAILSAPDLRTIQLAGAPSAVARAYFSASSGLVVIGQGLPAPPPGRVYHVWLIGSATGRPVSAGVLHAPGGRGMLIVPAPAGVAGTVTVAVTDESPGPAAAPSGSKQFAGS